LWKNCSCDPAITGINVVLWGIPLAVRTGGGVVGNPLLSLELLRRSGLITHIPLCDYG
jgi:cytochrome c-type biogenesis protein CcmH/NrfF